MGMFSVGRCSSELYGHAMEGLRGVENSSLMRQAKGATERFVRVLLSDDEMARLHPLACAQDRLCKQARKAQQALGNYGKAMVK